MITWKRTPQGKYESSYVYWDEKTFVHKPIYTIEKYGKGFVVYKKDKILLIDSKIAKLLGKDDTTPYFAKLKVAKTAVDLMENEETPYQTEEERGFAEGGGWSGAVWIDAEGKGGSWHTDINGYIIEG